MKDEGCPPEGGRYVVKSKDGHPPVISVITPRLQKLPDVVSEKPPQKP